jgi:predicted nucleic acid-binding protein
MKAIRAYVDTSVFGGCLDAEFETESRRFFDLVRAGQVVAMVSPVVLDELAGAPSDVREILESLPEGSVLPIDLSSDIIELRDAYIEAGIVSPRFIDDATHVAVATVSRADAIVSWNFKHIVRIDKMRAYNRVNLEHGFGLLSIVSPQEVRFDEED